MTAPTAATALTGGVALLERAMGYTLGSLVLVTPPAMANRTPCRDWDLGALLLHMNDSLQALQEAVSVGHVRLEPAGDSGPETDPVAALRDRAHRMIGEWVNGDRPAAISIAGRSLTPGVVAATGAVEVAVHGWDVARACGQDRPVPPALAEELLEMCPLFVGAADRPDAFAAEVPLPPLAGPGDRLLAFLGRRPR